MKKAIFVTGISASGKSSVCRALSERGFEAHDIEGTDMFKMVRKDTGEDFTDYDNTDIEKVKNADWICDTEKLKELLRAQKNSVAFYCGIATNNDELAPLFDQTILLKVSPSALRERLNKREGTGDFGTTEEGRKLALDSQKWFEDHTIAQEAVAVDADGNPADIVQKIVEHLGLS